jgi:hypothetical protein
MQRRLTQTPLGDGAYAKKPIRVADLLNAGLLKPGDSIYTSKAPNEWAMVADANYVTYQGQRWRYNDWGIHVTGWASVNIYQQVVLARTGQTLDELRQQLRQMDGNT